MACWRNLGFVLTVVVLCRVLEVEARIIRIKDCGKGTSLTKVDVTPCPREPCSFKHNTSAEITVWFNAVEDSKELKVKVYGIVDDIKIAFPIPNPDGCNKSGIKCPVKKSKSYVYRVKMKILPSYPSLRLVNEWDMFGDKGKMMFCFAFPLTIEPGNESSHK